MCRSRIFRLVGGPLLACALVVFASGLASKSTKSEISEQLVRLQAISSEAEDLVRIYDSKLEIWSQNPEAFARSVTTTDETYSRLLAARAIYEETLERLEAHGVSSANALGTLATANSTSTRVETEIETEIEVMAGPIREEIISIFAEEENQNAMNSLAVIAPGSGSSGNMTGSNFRDGRWALTYDDGPSKTYTPAILADLRKRGLKATFLEVAKNVVNLPAVSKAVRDGGHALGNHSYTHAQLTKLGSAGLKKEIDDSTTVETKYFGFKPKLFRCPYGSCGGNGSTIRQKIAAQGIVHVFWNVDSLDWQDRNAKSVYNRIKKQMAVQRGGIILVHDVHPQTVEATRMLMDDFVKGQRNGSLRLLTIPQAIQELNNGGME